MPLQQQGNRSAAAVRRTRWRTRTTSSLLTLAVIAALLTWIAPTASALDYSACDRTLVIGKSVQGRNILACERGDRSAPALLVMGQMHGNEKAGYWTAGRLLTMQPLPQGLHLWIIPTMNPDGFAHNRRQNAHGVDLNRNFPAGWKHRTGAYASGPRPASEPETRALISFVKTYQPHTTISIHQPLHLVDSSIAGDPAVTRFVARGMRYPWRGLGGSALPGTFTQWSNATVPWGTAITFEFGRTVSTSEQRRLVSTFISLGTWRSTAKYSTRLVVRHTVTTTDAGPLVTISGRLEWRSYRGVWVPLGGKNVSIETATAPEGPFTALRTVTAAPLTGAFRTYTHPTATQCVRTHFLGGTYLRGIRGPVTCFTPPA